MRKSSNRERERIDKSLKKRRGQEGTKGREQVIMTSNELLLTLKLTLAIAKAQVFVPAVPEPTNIPKSPLSPTLLEINTTTIPTTASYRTLSPSQDSFRGQFPPTYFPTSRPNSRTTPGVPTLVPTQPTENNRDTSTSSSSQIPSTEQQSSTPSLFPSFGLYTNTSNNITSSSEHPSISPKIDFSVLEPSITYPYPTLSPMVSMNPTYVLSYLPSESASSIAPFNNESWPFPSSNSSFSRTNQSSLSEFPTQNPSVAPSVPTIDEIVIPALTKFPSKSPSIASVTSIPTSNPSQSQLPDSPHTGFQVDPERSSGLSLKLIGIGEILDQRQWEKDTSAYIRSYFNDYALGPGRYGNDELRYAIFDVDATVKLMGQVSSNSGDGEVAVERTSNGALISPAVIVTYDQITTYKTSFQARVDLNYVLRVPFKTKASRYEYISYLQSASTEYDNITFVKYIPMTELPPPTKNIKEESSSSVGDSGPNWLIIGASIGAGVALIIIVIGLVVIARKRKHPSTNMLPVNNDPPSFHIDADDMSSITGVHSTCVLGTTEYSEVVVNISAPPGRLGVVVDTAPGGGPPYVCELRPGSVLEGQIRVGDKLIAVDAEDVQKMSAIRVSKLLAGKSVNSQRNITVLREVRNGDSIL